METQDRNDLPIQIFFGLLGLPRGFRNACRFLPSANELFLFVHSLLRLTRTVATHCHPLPFSLRSEWGSALEHVTLNYAKSMVMCKRRSPFEDSSKHRIYVFGQISMEASNKTIKATSSSGGQYEKFVFVGSLFCWNGFGVSKSGKRLLIQQVCCRS